MTQPTVDSAAAALKALQHDMLVGIASGQNSAVVMNLFCRRIGSLLPGTVSAVVDITDNNLLRVVAAPELPEAYAKAVNGTPPGMDAGWGADALLGHAGSSCRDLATDPAWRNCKPLALGLKSCWSMPIKARDGRALGFVALYTSLPRDVSDLEQHIVSSCADLCAISLETSKVRERNSGLALYDALTGLGNRAMLNSRLPRILEGAAEAGRTVNIFYVDIDDFRAVNELHGRATGDILLGRVANRLRSVGAEADLIVRINGDDFVLVMTAAGENSDVEVVARRIVEGVHGSYNLEDNNAVALSVSVGIARFPSDGRDADALMDQAEMALHRVKKSGPGFAVFTSEMREEQRRQRVLQRDIAMAGPSGQLSLVYQPQADVRSLSIGGFEALLRWHHPELGFISPAEFIPIAEASSAIGQIGEFVLREACKEAASWVFPVRVAVNVSPAQIARGDLATVIGNALACARLEPGRLEIEVTESLFIHDLDTALQTLKRVKDMGVSVALDDFGTGYSSLSTLRAFDFDRIKIDRSFVFDMIADTGAAAIVNSVLGLGRAMSLEVVAEGVETQQQLDRLGLLGCDLVQGYLIGKPLPASNYAAVTGAGQHARRLAV